MPSLVTKCPETELRKEQTYSLNHAKSAEMHSEYFANELKMIVSDELMMNAHCPAIN